MAAFLYLETNFLLGVATGRYDVDALAAARPAGVDLAIPRSCFMESFAAVEVVIARRRRFGRLLDRRIKKLRTELFLPRVPAIVSQLDLARVEHDLLADEVRLRLLAGIERLVSAAVVIDEPTGVLTKSLREPLIEQPTDNLILHAILDHAAAHPAAGKALLTENAKDFRQSDEAKKALRSAGIVLHGTYANAIAWMQHAAAAAPPPSP